MHARVNVDVRAAGATTTSKNGSNLENTVYYRSAKKRRLYSSDTKKRNEYGCAVWAGDMFNTALRRMLLMRGNSPFARQPDTSECEHAKMQ